MAEYFWLTIPVELIKTAGTSSDIWILVGSGSPDGNADPALNGAKASVWFRDDRSDDQPFLYGKVDNDGSDDDWEYFLMNRQEADATLEGDLTMDADKRVYFRDTDTSIYSDSACKLYVAAASGIDIEKMTVGSGTYFNSFLAGSGTIVYGSLSEAATSTASLSVTGLTQEHKIFLSPSSVSGSLNIHGVSCSPGGGLLALTVTALSAYAGGNVVFGYTAFAACG